MKMNGNLKLIFLYYNIHNNQMLSLFFYLENEDEQKKDVVFLFINKREILDPIHSQQLIYNKLTKNHWPDNRLLLRFLVDRQHTSE